MDCFWSTKWCGRNIVPDSRSYVIDSVCLFLACIFMIQKTTVICARK